MRAKKHSHQWRLQVAIAILTVFALSISYVSSQYVGTTSEPQNRAPIEGASHIDEVMPVEPSYVIENDSKSLPMSVSVVSPDRSYVFTLYKIAKEDFCFFSLTNKDGNSINIASLLHTTKIPCSANGDLVSVGSLTWIDNQNFQVDTGNGVYLVNAAEKKAVKK